MRGINSFFSKPSSSSTDNFFNSTSLYREAILTNLRIFFILFLLFCTASDFKNDIHCFLDSEY